MFRTTARLMLGLIVFSAMGLAQLLGVSRGFLCDCSDVPKLAAMAACHASECHPHHDHKDGCTDELAAGPARTGEATGELADPCGHGHEHEHLEVRDALKVTSGSSSLSVPVPVFYDLPPSLQVAASMLPVSGSLSRRARPGRPEDGSPPVPLMVARTMVMRV